MKKKEIVFGIGILLLICFFSGNINASDNTSSLNGYVTSASSSNAKGLPISGAYVCVSFHGTFLDTYSDSSGYYHITGIPSCRCLKNVTVSKDGYQSVTVWLSILGNCQYDFTLVEY